MNKFALATLFSLSSLLAVPAVEAASVTPNAVEFEKVGFVNGVDGFTQKVDLDGGSYNLTLTDFNFGDSFSKLGVMLSTSTEPLYKLEKPVGAVASGANNIWQKSIDMDLDAGQYYLSFFGKSAGDFSFYGVSLTQNADEPAPVPVPAAFILFGSGLLAMTGLVRRQQTA